MKRLIRNEKGIALMMVMVMATISLAVMAALLYMVTIGARMSGIGKRFQTSLEAGRSGVEFIEAVVASQGALSNGLVDAISYKRGSSMTSEGETCLNEKIRKPTDEWDSSCERSSSIDPEAESTYDFRFDMGNYEIFSKIVLTVDGNATGTGGSGAWSQGASVWGSPSGNVQYIPALYSIELLSRNRNAKSEKSRFSLLYRY